MKIHILVDNKNSWYIPYAQQLLQELLEREHQARLVHQHEDISEGDILLLLSCTKIFTKLHLHQHNLVVHASNMPKGRGFAHLTWLVLEGADTIPVTLLEATDAVDAGDIYSQDFVKLDGHELINEIRSKVGKATNDLILDFIRNYPENIGKKQVGDPTFYRRRRPEDSELDVNYDYR